MENGHDDSNASAPQSTSAEEAPDRSALRRREVLRLGVVGASVPVLLTLAPERARAEGSWGCLSGAQAGAEGSWSGCDEPSGAVDGRSGSTDGYGAASEAYGHGDGAAGRSARSWVMPGGYEWRLQRRQAQMDQERARAFGRAGRSRERR